MLRETIEKLIVDPDIKLMALQMIAKAPKKFWLLPASISGYYHAADERGEGGLELHTVRVMHMCLHSCSTLGLMGRELDICLAACAIHDIVKYGDDTVETIGDQGREALRRHGSAVMTWGRVNGFIGEPAEQVLTLASKHNGRWSEPNYIPVTAMEKAVHYADFFARRDNVQIDTTKSRRRDR